MAVVTLAAWVVVLVAGIRAAAWLFTRLDRAAWRLLDKLAARSRRRP